MTQTRTLDTTLTHNIDTSTPVIIWENKWIGCKHMCRYRCVSDTGTHLISEVSVLQEIILGDGAHLVRIFAT